MYHRTRWTPEKIKQRLELIARSFISKENSFLHFTIVDWKVH